MHPRRIEQIAEDTKNRCGYYFRAGISDPEMMELLLEHPEILQAVEERDDIVATANTKLRTAIGQVDRVASLARQALESEYDAEIYQSNSMVRFQLSQLKKKGD